MFKKLFLFLAICMMTLRVNGQSNQIAYNGVPSMSVTELTLMHTGLSFAMPSEELYEGTWDNYKAHSYTSYIPNSYRIDLRDFSMPIHHTQITSGFGYRAKFKRNHQGVDIKANIGDTVRSAFRGKVRVVRNNPGGYGNFVVVRHYNGLETVYGHLSKQIVHVNDEVNAGDPIGLAGNTGRSTGPHLHFETRFCGIPIDPRRIFTFNTKDVVDDYFVFKK